MSVIAVPCFVKRTPTDNGRMVEISMELSLPFHKEGSKLFHIGAVNTPVTCFAEYKITKLIAVVKESLLKHLLVKSCTVKACIKGEINIANKLLLCFSGINTLLVEALVKNCTKVGWLIVKEIVFLVKASASYTEVALNLIISVSCIILLGKRSFTS